MKYIKSTTPLNYPSVYWRDTKTMLVDLEYKIQHSHTGLLVPGNSCASWQVSCK